MPRSKVNRKKLFREVSFLDKKYINKNHLKNLRSVRLRFCKANNISYPFLEFLLWAYDKEFWTIDYASKEFGVKRNNFCNRFLWPIIKDGYVYKHFDKLTPSGSLEDHLFREETKFNYRVRYAITQKARLLVQRFYNELEA